MKFALFIVIFLSNVANAGQLTLRIGPPSVGNGGTNPVGIPPSIQDCDLTWLSASDLETNISVVPGILVGKRSKHPSGIYLSLGGGIVTSANGIGLGPYSGFGVDLGSGSFKFNAEFKQALGITSNGLVSPYALRLGVSYDFGK